MPGRVRIRVFSAVAGVLLALVAARAEAADTPGEWLRPFSAIADAWRTRKEILAVGQDRLALKELDQILALKEEFRLNTLPSVSMALLREIREREGMTTEEGQKLLEYADKFSPNHPGVAYFYCGYGLKLLALTASVQKCADGWKAEFEDLGSLLRFGSNATLILLGILAAFVAMFGAYLLVHYVRPITHQTGHRFSRISPTMLTALGAGLLIAAGLVAGPLGAFLLLVLILWKYMRTGERVVATLMFVILAALPFAFLLPALYTRFERNLGPVWTTPLQGPSLLADGAALSSWLEVHPNDAENLFLLARYERAIGRTDRARELLDRAARARPSWHKPLVNLAVLDYAEHKSQDAIDRLKKASSLDAHEIIPHFNLGKIFYLETQLEEGLSHLRKAKEIDADLLDRLEKATDPNRPDRVLAEETLSQEDINERFRKVDPEVTTIRDGIQESVFPGIPPLALWIALAATFGAAILSSQLRPAGRLPRACQKCGRPSCAICDPALEHESLCAQCYPMFVRLETMEADVRMTKQREIVRFNAWREFRERWIALLCPGAHRMFRGDFFVAGFLLTWTGVSLAGLIFASYLLPDRFELPGITAFPTVVFAGTCFAAVYLVSMLDALRR